MKIYKIIIAVICLFGFINTKSSAAIEIPGPGPGKTTIRIEFGKNQGESGGQPNFKNCSEDTPDTCDVTLIYHKFKGELIEENIEAIYHNDSKEGSLDIRVLSSGVYYDDNGKPVLHRVFKYNLPLYQYSSFDEFFKKAWEYFEQHQ